MFQLAGISFNKWDFQAENRFNPDILTNETLQHIAKAADYAVHIYDFRLIYLFAAEGQELTYEVFRFFPGLKNGNHLAMAGMILLYVQNGHFGMSVDHREQVVEIVSNAACQRADRLHLLGLDKLPFKLFSLRNVAQNSLNGKVFQVAEIRKRSFNIDFPTLFREAGKFKLRLDFFPFYQTFQTFFEDWSAFSIEQLQ